jgi:hypothetical protein
MNERIKQLAEQAGITFDAEMCEGWIADDEDLERFADLVRQEERASIIKILKGIDQTETESEDGYWETSVGAEFGANIIKQIRERTE